MRFRAVKDQALRVLLVWVTVKKSWQAYDSSIRMLHALVLICELAVLAGRCTFKHFT